jgi:hypothetical protein
MGKRYSFGIPKNKIDRYINSLYLRFWQDLIQIQGEDEINQTEHNAIEQRPTRCCDGQGVWAKRRRNAGMRKNKHGYSMRECSCSEKQNKKRPKIESPKKKMNEITTHASHCCEWRHDVHIDWELHAGAKDEHVEADAKRGQEQCRYIAKH